MAFTASIGIEDVEPISNSKRGPDPLGSEHGSASRIGPRILGQAGSVLSPPADFEKHKVSRWKAEIQFATVCIPLQASQPYICITF